jgi:hypothetical protein
MTNGRMLQEMNLDQDQKNGTCEAVREAKYYERRIPSLPKTTSMDILQSSSHELQHQSLL